ncbi:bifunctional precorrin-2 dehydrogenase/sirohydrochlorin ferrochelatase [Salibacterium salarium]|uniref:precorrin-2 dehydrogenase n=2 Tax=Salibacterium salarium TaxID=284579 RepID=A0A428N002_9BACI|nr:bifunctional precorrin-2 dehydrogenase/sirohydrochlorin ferrochelatase [Salibacterium salarium]
MKHFINPFYLKRARKMFDFPLFLDMTGKPAVVVGGGKVAARKTKKLLGAGADITVVAPTIHDDLTYLYDQGDIDWIKDICREDYVTSAFIIISASGDGEAQRIIRESMHPFQLVNGADNPELGNTVFPAAFQDEEFHVAVSTNGASPTAAKSVKRKLQKWFAAKNYRK